MEQSNFHRIGVSAQQEHIYRCLIEQPNQSLAALQAVAPDVPDIGAELMALQDLGLVTQDADAHWLVTNPEAAIAVLLSEQQRELDAMRLESMRLAEHVRANRQHQNVNAIVEVLTGDALREYWDDSQRTASQRVRMTDRPPYFNPPSLESLETERTRIAEGLEYQVLYDQVIFDDPGHAERVLAAVGWGEQARVMPNVPLKLVLVDDACAMLMISKPQQTAEPAVIVVRPSALLDALSALFDLLWSRGVAVNKQGEQQEDEAGVPRALLQLLAMGMKDEAIAMELGVTVRTVRRRISDLYQELGVHNRFQAGMAAQARGWL